MRALNFPLFLIFIWSSFCEKSEAIPMLPPPKASCHVHDIEKSQGTSGEIISKEIIPLRETPCKEDFYQKKPHSGNPIEAEVLKLQEDSRKKVAELLQDNDFQETIDVLKGKLPSMFTTKQEKETKSGELYIFVSFSLGEKALENLAQEAKRYGATLVLRGFKDGSHLKTVKSLEKIIRKSGQGFIIDPELYTLFAIQAVPAYVLAKPFQLQSEERMQTPIHDRLQGYVSLQYALESFAKKGDLKDEAKSLLRKEKSQ